eukprot:8048664-Pyramimonas_sp.AAC.2
MGIYCLPSCDWFSRWAYTAAPHAIGSQPRGVSGGTHGFDRQSQLHSGEPKIPKHELIGRL